MLIKIDMREKELIDRLQSLREMDQDSVVSIETGPLPIGDIIICDNDGRERTIIERKTLKDLAASIRDGRYSEQSFRLNECSMHNHNIAYLVEGDLSTFTPGRLKIGKDALISAFITISFYKGFSLHRTISVDESAQWLYQFATKLAKKGGNGYFETGVGEQAAAPSYSEVIKRTKKECITTKNIGEIMLSQVPNVSMATATRVMETFGSVSGLARALENNPSTLDGIIIEGKSGKSRRISKTARESIYRYLVSEAQQPCVNE